MRNPRRKRFPGRTRSSAVSWYLAEDLLLMYCVRPPALVGSEVAGTCRLLLILRCTRTCRLRGLDQALWSQVSPIPVDEFETCGTRISFVDDGPTMRYLYKSRPKGMLAFIVDQDVVGTAFIFKRICHIYLLRRTTIRSSSQHSLNNRPSVHRRDRVGCQGNVKVHHCTTVVINGTVGPYRGRSVNRSGVPFSTAIAWPFGLVS
jgi:hypothetical protein